MKTLKQLEKECNMSHAGLDKRINKINGFRQKYMKKIKGTWFVKDNGVHFINDKKNSYRPKHYRHPIDHPKTRYDVERDNIKMRDRLDNLIQIIKSQQKTISSQEEVIKEKS